jgi:hypothetical protein
MHTHGLPYTCTGGVSEPLYVVCVLCRWLHWTRRRKRLHALLTRHHLTNTRKVETTHNNTTRAHYKDLIGRPLTSLCVLCVVWYVGVWEGPVGTAPLG